MSVSSIDAPKAPKAAAVEAAEAVEPERDFLTVEQTAQYLHMSASSIRSYIRQGKLKAFRIAGLRKVLIPREAVIALLEPLVRTL